MGITRQAWTQDPCDTIYVVDDDKDLPVANNIYSEDADEWERLADAALDAAGWTRVAPWRESGSMSITTVVSK